MATNSTTADPASANAAAAPQAAAPGGSTSAVTDKQTEESATASAFSKHYTHATSLLPGVISSRLPSAATAEAGVDSLSAKLGVLGASAGQQATSIARSGSKRIDQIKDAKFGERLTPELMTKCAWSVQNQTQVALNVSLNQVGPLMYEVLGPNEIFERRTPPVWYALEVRAFTTKDSAYTPWSVAWPIMAVTGPVVAGISLVAIPFVALASGGAALASLTGLGSSAAAGAAATASTISSTVTTAAGYASKASLVPGGAKMKGKLTDAAKKNATAAGRQLSDQVVKYLGKGTAAAALSGLIGGGAAADGDAKKAQDELERKREEEQRGREKDRVGKRGKKLDEVDVTGLELEKVLACETGKKRTDKALEHAFKKLNLKTSKGLKTVENPVLRIVGGPELEERGKKSFLVFYPFTIERVPEVEVIPLDTNEAPPTEAETNLIRDARVVETAEDAQSISDKTPYQNGAPEVGKKVDEAVEEIDAKKGAAGGEKKGWLASWRG